MIILASGSPRRQELMRQAGFEFAVRPAEVDETNTDPSPAKRVEELSARKAKHVYESSREIEDCIVIGSDTLVASGETILGKPKDRDEAIGMIRQIAGTTHEVHTGVTVMWREDGKDRSCTWSETTEVEVYPMTDEEIASYADSGEPYDKAGGYGIQGAFAVYVKGIRGDYNNVVGLPLASLWQKMKQLGLLKKVMAERFDADR